MKKVLVGLAFAVFSSTAAAEGLPAWLAGLIAWVQHQAMHDHMGRQDRR